MQVVGDYRELGRAAEAPRGLARGRVVHLGCFVLVRRGGGGEPDEAAHRFHKARRAGAAAHPCLLGPCSTYFGQSWRRQVRGGCLVSYVPLAQATISDIPEGSRSKKGKFFNTSYSAPSISKLK